MRKRYSYGLIAAALCGFGAAQATGGWPRLGNPPQLVETGAPAAADDALQTAYEERTQAGFRAYLLESWRDEARQAPILDWLRDRIDAASADPNIALLYSDFLLRRSRDLRAADPARADAMQATSASMFILFELIYGGDALRCAGFAPGRDGGLEDVAAARRPAVAEFLRDLTPESRDALVTAALDREARLGRRPPNAAPCLHDETAAGSLVQIPAAGTEAMYVPQDLWLPRRKELRATTLRYYQAPPAL